MADEKIRKGILFLIFLFFITLHADQLHLARGAATLRINNGVAIILLIVLLAQPPKILRIDKRVAISFAFLLVAAFISCMSSPALKRSLIFYCWLFFTLIFYFILPYLLIHRYTTEQILKCYFSSFLAVGGIAALQGILSACGLHAPYAYQLIRGTLVRPNAFCYEPSFYALYMTPFVVFTQLKASLFPEDEKRAKKRERRQLFFAHFLFLISTATSTLFAYVLLIMILAFFALFSSWPQVFPRLKKAVMQMVCLYFSLFLTLFFLFPSLTKQFFFKFFHRNFHEHHSFFERFVGLINTWKLFLKHPWFGVGLGAVPSALYQAWREGSQRFLFLFSEADLADTNRALKLFEPSNVLTELLASVGILGCLPFLFLIGRYFQLVARAKREVNDPRQLGGVFFFLISFIVQIIVLQFNQGIFRTYIWVHFALAFAFTEKTIRNASSQPFLEAPLPEARDENRASIAQVL